MDKQQDKMTKAELMEVIALRDGTIVKLKNDTEQLRHDLVESNASNHELSDKIAILNAAAPEKKEQTTDTRIAKLVEALDRSCSDHCPYKGPKVEACENCTIAALKCEALA